MSGGGKKSHADLTFDTNLGQKAIVEHHTFEDKPELEQLRAVLADMGEDLQRIGVAPKEYNYMGSFSVHVYESNLRGQFAFVSVHHPHKTYFKLAEAAGMKLRGDIQKMFRGTMQKLRSGFSGV